MIIDVVAVKLHTLESLLPYPSNPSGTYVEQKTIYTHGYDKSAYPVLLLPEKLYDNAGNFIPDGYYMIVLTDDKKFFLFIESDKLKARVPAYKIEDVPLPQSEIDAEVEYKLEMEKYKKKGNIKKHALSKDKLDKLKIRQEARMSVDIYDSGKDYFILKYRNNQIRAEGIIPK